MLATRGKEKHRNPQYCRFPVRRLFRILPVAGLAAILFAACPPKIIRVKVSPEDLLRANQLSQEADMAFARRDNYAALIKYLEAARLNPNSEYVYNKLGIAYSQLKFYTEASAAFVRCIGLNPKFPYAYNNLGSVYFAMSDLKKAERYFKKAISINSGAASFHVNLGSVYIERKQTEKAKAAWQKALSIDPNVLTRPDSISLPTGGRSPVERYYFLARIHASIGNVDLAVENLQLALNAGFTDIELIRNEHDFDPIRQEEKFVAFMKTAALLTIPPEE